MSFLAPAIPALVTAGVQFGASKLLGGKGNPTAPLTAFSPPGFSGGGLTGSFSGNSFNVNPTAARTGAVNSLSSTFGAQAGDVAALRSTVAPGFSQFRRAGMAALENQRKSTISTLRENLAQRRISGSSFGQDSLTRANAQYAQNEAEFSANAYLSELQANENLIQQQYTAARGEFQTQLSEMNFEAGIAADMAGKASSTLATNAQTEAKLDALSQQGAGQFYGQITQPVAKALGNSFSGLNFGGRTSGPDLAGGIWPA